MASRRRELANRANAARSTGPKTRLGRLYSSQNALTHGLSRPLDPASVAPLIEQLQGLLFKEGLEARAAKELAIKILEFERNIERQREIHRKRLAGKLVDAIGIADHVYELEPMMAWTEEFAVGRLLPDIPEWEESLRDAAKFVVRRSRERVSRRVHFERRDAPESLRYLRRASNQLVKAMRRL